MNDSTLATTSSNGVNLIDSPICPNIAESAARSNSIEDSKEEREDTQFTFRRGKLPFKPVRSFVETSNDSTNDLTSSAGNLKLSHAPEKSHHGSTSTT